VVIGITQSDLDAAPSAYRIEQARLGELHTWVLHDDGADLHATWVPEAGMLGASLVHHGEELLWQGAGPGGYANTRAFMGIPFLHPWANRLDRFGYRAGGLDVELDPASPLLLLDDNGLPIHGLLNATDLWTVREAAAGPASARLLAGLEFEDPALLAAFPFPHRLTMTVELAGEGLRVTVVLSATGGRAVPVCFGFHPYFQLPEVPRSGWEVEFPVRRRLALGPRMLPTGATEPAQAISGAISERTWDDCFDRIDSSAPFKLSGGRRMVAVELEQGYTVAQIFAPPGQEYLCIEPMTAPVNALSGGRTLAWVRPGERHGASFRVSCHLR
jgi:aldose 1-epimerase